MSTTDLTPPQRITAVRLRALDRQAKARAEQADPIAYVKHLSTLPALQPGQKRWLDEHCLSGHLDLNEDGEFCLLPAMADRALNRDFIYQQLARS